MRLLLTSSTCRSVRVPPVFELTASDLPYLYRVLARTDVLVCQPVRSGYRGLPLGTGELSTRLAAGARVVLFPVLRYAGLYPYQAIVRGPAGDPPVVPYHDLRTLTAFAGGVRTVAGIARSAAAVATAAAYTRIAAQSIEELQRRQSRHGTVAAADLFTAAGVDAAYTVNHPGNPVLIGVARRVQERLGWPVTAADPGRTLLNEVHTPLEPAVIDALGLDAEPRLDWQVAGNLVSDDDVRAAHLEWYAQHPDMVTAGLERHRDTIAVLGL
jgi:hypothetical protein